MKTKQFIKVIKKLKEHCSNTDGKCSDCKLKHLCDSLTEVAPMEYDEVTFILIKDGVKKL